MLTERMPSVASLLAPNWTLVEVFGYFAAGADLRVGKNVTSEGRQSTDGLPGQPREAYRLW